ncbi:MAG: hypothetical protein JNK66_07185 [Chitinophagales bacterium]|nr:hypothetical protein [Chitinophagales bacterium]
MLNTAATVFDKIAVTLSNDKNPLKKFSALFRDISSKLAEIKGELKKAGETVITGLELINAFLCGVINGLLSPLLVL